MVPLCQLPHHIFENHPPSPLPPDRRQCGREFVLNLSGLCVLSMGLTAASAPPPDRGTFFPFLLPAASQQACQKPACGYGQQ